MYTYTVIHTYTHTYSINISSKEAATAATLCAPGAPASGALCSVRNVCSYIYIYNIYVYRERERYGEREIYLYIYIYIYCTIQTFRSS